MLNPVFLYEIIPNALRSSSNPKVKPRPHADGLVVQVLNLWIQFWNRSVNCQSTNLFRDKTRLCLNPPKRWVCFRCNRRTRRVTNNPKGIKIMVRTIIRAGIGMKMLILMTRTLVMLRGTSNLNVRLNFLASYVRRITSLTCALGWKKPQDS